MTDWLGRNNVVTFALGGGFSAGYEAELRLAMKRPSFELKTWLLIAINFKRI